MALPILPEPVDSVIDRNGHSEGGGPFDASRVASGARRVCAAISCQVPKAQSRYWLSFHTYTKVASLAVATLRLPL